MKKIGTVLFAFFVLFAHAQNGTDTTNWPTIDIPPNVAEAMEIVEEWEEEQFGDLEEEGEEIYRTSDQTGERGTSWHNRLGESAVYDQVPDGSRTACICMDGQRRNERGRGACSGHGGVRYWVYRMPSGEEVLYATARHRDHPADLNNIEISNLSAHNEDDKAEKTVTIRVTSLYEWATALAVCSIMALFFRHLYVNTEYFDGFKRG